MLNQKGKSVISNTNTSPPNPQNSALLEPSYDNPILTPCLSKFQKTQISSLNIPNHYSFLQFPSDGAPGTSYQQSDMDSPPPAQNHTDQQSKETIQKDNGQKNDSSEPFFYYQDSHVQDSLNQCKISIIGKILSNKPISNQVLHNTLTGIWSNPMGFKIAEIEGRILQFKMDKEENVQRILKGNPWIIRNCWLILHGWDRNMDVSRLDFSSVPLWIQFRGLPLH